jgi:carbonic anhydrase
MAEHPQSGPFVPQRQLFVLACMDARLNVEQLLRLKHGDAHIVRNAGGIVTDDVRRSLLLSQRAMNTREVAVIQHTRCGMEGLDDAGFKDALEAETGHRLEFALGGFSDVRNAIRETVRELSEWDLLPHRDRVRGYIYDVDTRQLHQVAGSEAELHT